MKKTYLVVLLLTLLANSFSALAQKGSSSSPNFGIGLRLGDPSGITLKKYMGDNALELSIGKSYMFQGSGRYYDNRFNHWYNDWYKDYPHYKDFQYQGYSNSSPISFQLHYLFQKDLGNVDNLQWYWGIGAQLRFQKYTFNYRYKLDGNPNWFYGDERITDIDLGADGVIGLEYTLPSIPLSFFGDATIFMEVADNPFAFWFQAGVGARYNF